jgi:hypothetical protein
MGFPDQLETLIKRTRPSVEVLNTGVLGYTAYNELQYYLTKGRTFQPDVVLVAFCLNDIANPRLHWDYTEERLGDIPAKAIPNSEYDRVHAIPLLRRRQEEQARKSRQLFRRSRLYQLVDQSIRKLWGDRPEHLPDENAKIPTHVTGEDTLSIEVLIDEHSPESQWLRSTYDELDAAVRGDGARLAIVMFPLAYQMDPAYPHVPQQQLMDYCRHRSIPCLDLLPALRAHPRSQMFLLERYDIWHLTEKGHAVAAETISRFLLDSGLLDQSAAVSR